MAAPDGSATSAERTAHSSVPRDARPDRSAWPERVRPAACAGTGRSPGPARSSRTGRRRALTLPRYVDTNVMRQVISTELDLPVAEPAVAEQRGQTEPAYIAFGGLGVSASASWDR